MKVKEAFVCLECDEIFHCRHKGPDGHVTAIRGYCPACGSMSLWPVGKWIKPLEKERICNVPNAAARK